MRYPGLAHGEAPGLGTNLGQFVPWEDPPLVLTDETSPSVAVLPYEEPTGVPPDVVPFVPRYAEELRGQFAGMAMIGGAILLVMLLMGARR